LSNTKYNAYDIHVQLSSASKELTIKQQIPWSADTTKSIQDVIWPLLLLPFE